MNFSEQKQISSVYLKQIQNCFLFLNDDDDKKKEKKLVKSKLKKKVSKKTAKKLSILKSSI